MVYESENFIKIGNPVQKLKGGHTNTDNMMSF
jgi:hypothetical protein